MTTKAPVILIDVQPAFLDGYTDRKIYVDKVVEVVEKAKKERRHIYVVEFRDQGRTTHRVRAALANYPFKTLIVKDEDDGSSLLHPLMQKAHPKTRSVKICGLNLECCVRDTIKGMLRKHEYRFSVIKPATINVWDDRYRSADPEFPNMFGRNRKLVRMVSR